MFFCQYQITHLQDGSSLGFHYNNWLVNNLVVLVVFVKMIFQSNIG
jgi:hypothetical protein